MKSSISVIIVSYNSSDVIESCLTELVRPADFTLEIIVVDNASTDSTVELISSKYPTVKLIQNPDNVGFAAAVNRGADQAEGEFIALLNPDAVITCEALSALCALQRNHASPSVVAPRILQPHGRLRIVSAGRFPSPWRMFCHYWGPSRAFKSPSFEGHYLFESRLERVTSVDWVTGAMLLVRRSDWLGLGGLTERWFMYAEDIEFCWRARARGMDVLLARDITATHLVGGSSSEVQSSRADWVINLLDFYRTSMGGSRMGILAWKVIVSSGLRLRAFLYRIESRRISDPARKQLWARESVRFSSFAADLMKVRA